MMRWLWKLRGVRYEKRCPVCKKTELARQGYGTTLEQARGLVSADLTGWLGYLERRTLHGQTRWRCVGCGKVFWTGRGV